MATATDFDRRWIFLAIGVLVLGLYAYGSGEPMPVSLYVQDYFDTIEALPEGSVVLLSADFDPGSAAELLPTYLATIHHLLLRKLRIINVSTWPAGPPFTRAAFAEIPPQYGAVYGEHWIELGFKAGDDVAMAQIGQSLLSSFAQDDREKTAVTSFPIMQGISDSFQGVSLLITMSAGYPGVLEWIAQAGGRYDVPILAATTAVQTPDLFAYYPSQLKGFAGAATGATQYLQLVVAAGVPALVEMTTDNQERMLIQTYAHLLIIGLIVTGNLLYFFGGRGR